MSESAGYDDKAWNILRQTGCGQVSISERWAYTLLKNGRVADASRFGHAGMIPGDAEKPIGSRKERQERGKRNHTGKKGGGGHGE